jgi:hypothetical protein
LKILRLRMTILSEDFMVLFRSSKHISGSFEKWLRTEDVYFGKSGSDE